MPRYGQKTDSLTIVPAGTEKKPGVGCRLCRLRDDIWIARLEEPAAPSSADARALRLHTSEPALALAFAVPGPGKGSDMLPEGTFRVLPAGVHPLRDAPDRGLVLCITENRLREILEDDVKTLPARVKALLDARPDEAKGAERMPLSPDIALAGNALLNCPYEGAVRNMFYKSKALELIALFFGQLAGQERGADGGRLSARDRSLIGTARQQLLAHMDDPPGLRQLARRAGTNETKLKRLFKEAYGLSPFAYLRMERMTAARKLIVEKGANVSEAALSVGYTNVSHFIEAFARQYGVRPGELLPRRGASGLP